MERSWKRFGIKAVAASAFILFVVFVYRCPIRLIFGTECPGCGLKRALFCALRLDFAGAWDNHPLFLLLGAEVVYVLLTLFFPRLRVSKTAELVIGIATLVLLGLVWLGRKC